MFVAASFVRAVGADLRRFGVDSVALGARVSLDEASLANPSARVPIRTVRKLVEDTIAASGRRDIALRLGALAPLHALHVLGPMIRSARTLRRGLELFRLYGPLVVEGASLELLERGDLAFVRFAHPMLEGSESRYAAEYASAFMCRVGEAFLGPHVGLERARFRHADPGYAATYAEVFDGEVEFGAAHDELVLRKELLDRPQLEKDDALCALLERRAAELLAALDEEAPLPVRLRELLANEPRPLELDVGDAASRLGVSSRTLQRRLREAGSSFSGMIDDELRRRACDELAVSRLAIKEIADRAGFVDPNNFHRAFKRWTGETPGEFRRRVRAGECA